MYLQLLDYTAYLRQASGDAAFPLPLLEVKLKVGKTGSMLNGQREAI